jgi:pimeloyl-ACP methyl ester carboxylesterase
MQETTQDQRLMSKTTVYSNDVELAVTSYGEPHNPTIVLVHGYPDSSVVWCKVVEYLKHHFHVVTYDVRGCGDSTEPQWLWDYSLSRLSEDLQAVMRAVCPTQPVHIVAHDWGSIQSWESVTDHRLRARIASFTSISGPCLDHVGMWLRHGLSTNTASALKSVLGQALSSWYVYAFQLPFLAPMAWKMGLDKAWPKMLAKMEGAHHVQNPTQLKDGVNGINLYRANVLPRMGNPRIRQTDLPVQFLVPLRDKFVTPAMIESAYPYLQDVWRRDIDAHHWVIQSEAEWVAHCVGEFVEFAETGRENPSLAKARVQG